MKPWVLCPGPKTKQHKTNKQNLVRKVRCPLGSVLFLRLTFWLQKHFCRLPNLGNDNSPLPLAPSCGQEVQTPVSSKHPDFNGTSSSTRWAFKASGYSIGRAANSSEFLNLTFLVVQLNVVMHPWMCWWWLGCRRDVVNLSRLSLHGFMTKSYLCGAHREETEPLPTCGRCRFSFPTLRWLSPLHQENTEVPAIRFMVSD